MPALKQGHCPTLHPAREQFERPFAEYVAEVFRKHPDWACFKVVPPKEWRPRREEYDLHNVQIGTPIRQHAFGTSGAFKAILEEHASMTAAEYKKIATSPDRRPPKKGHKEDTMLERAFWSTLTFNPPLYGADTPISLFDTQSSWGWNLRNLGDLLKQHKVPEIPGVTSPMTYFGMWRAFFAWHKEDCDLFSVNYLHFGAPKVWYAVPPSASDRFDAMARQIFPDAAAACPAFTRHKDVLISPKLLRTYNIPFVQARQRAGEFIVLNAAAYHSGFNMGFNCAEAVNFALPQWADVGRDCSTCECGALPETVQVDMSIMFPGIYDSTTDEDSEEDSSSEDSSSNSDSSSSSSSSSGSDDGSDSEDESSGAKRKRHAPAVKNWAQSKAPGSGLLRAWERTKGASSGRKRERPPPLSSEHAGKTNKKNKKDEKNNGSKSTEGVDAAGKPASKRHANADGGKTRRVAKILEVAPLSSSDPLPKGALDSSWGNVLESRPVALVVKDPQSKAKSFEIVHRLNRTHSENGTVWVGVLEQGEDGMYRPTRQRRLVQMGCFFPRLTRVRVEWVPAEGRRRGGWVLLTKSERILM